MLAELSLYHQYNYDRLTSIKIRRKQKNMYYPCCRVDLKAATFDLWFSLDQTITHVIIINNCRMNYVFLNINTVGLRTINIYRIYGRTIEFNDYH